MQILDSSNSAVTESAYCDGFSSLVLTQRFCQVPMTRFRTFYGLVLGDLIEV